MLGKDYRVLERIGVGGMAIVYLVEHQTLLKRFAAKVLSRDLASSLEARARFTQEAHAASQLDHENIVSISDFGATVDNRPFFVMELLRGQTLDQRLAEGRMTIEEVVAVCVPVARALAHAHTEGIVHLDVKPENIFLVQRSQGRWGVKVVDFGIAKTPQNPRLAKPEETAGSPMFMAPEVCRGDDDVDLRADVYSFGILLYLMMCGRLPFLDDSLHRVLQMQLIQLPAPPREINAELSPELAAIVERALAKLPDDRYPSMDALLRDLEAALPEGSDRLLIEAQSGIAVGETPFAGALSLAPHRALRASQPPPNSSGSSGPTPPSTLPVTPPSTLPWSPPSAAASSLPPAPQRRRVLIVIATAAATTIAGAVILWQVTTAPAADRAGPNNSAAGNLPASSLAAIAPPRTAAATDTPPTAVAAPPPPAPAPSASDGKATPVFEAKAEHPIAKKPLVRTRSLTERELPRPDKRVDRNRPAGSAPPTRKDAPAPPLAAAPAGSQAPGSQAVDAKPSSGASPTDDGRTGHAEAGPDRGATADSPPPAIVPVKPAAPADPGTLDATPEVVGLDVKGSLSPAIVRRSVERTLPSLRACYRSAARASGSTPAIELRLTFEIDENSLATQVATSGANLGSLAGCVAGVASQIRTKEAPDVGTAQVAVVIRFRPS